jgi:hypothetical protein
MRWAGLALLLVSCGTRFIDLTLPPDASTGNPGQDALGMVRCEVVKRGDGTECNICYAADGTLVKGACVPPAPPVMVPGSDPGTVASCKVAPAGDSRCLYCAAPNGEYTACLKCEGPVKTGNMGEVCRACFWSDQSAPMTRCLQCFAADGVATHDDCDALRSETFARMPVPSK